MSVSKAYDAELQKLEDAARKRIIDAHVERLEASDVRASASVSKKGSMHPRMGFTKERRHKKNCAGTKKRKTVQRVLSAIEEHVERHPNDAMSKGRIPVLAALLASLPQPRVTHTEA